MAFPSPLSAPNLRPHPFPHTNIFFTPHPKHKTKIIHFDRCFANSLPSKTAVSLNSAPATTSVTTTTADNNTTIATSDVNVQPSPTSLRGICQGHVPDLVLRRMDELGFVTPTKVQEQGLPVLFSGTDCILHAQTGSGKTLTYLLLIYSVINAKRSAVQALIVVPTRELGMQVTKVARTLAKSYSVMALLDGGMLKRQKIWLKAETPTIVVATVTSLCRMLERHALNLEAVKVLVIDEVDFLFNSSKEINSLRKLLTSYSSINSRQTVFASASIPSHKRFLHDCVQHKWTKSDVVHVHVNAVQPMPSCLYHRHVISPKDQKYQALHALLQSDLPESAIIFANVQSEKSKKTGNLPTTTSLVDFLKTSCGEFSDILLLEEDMNFHARAASLLELKKKRCYLLVATDIAARGVDLPETTHIYNFDLPKSAVHYLHRAGRTGRKPFGDQKCMVTSIVPPEERFVLQRFESELRFNSVELFL